MLSINTKIKLNNKAEIPILGIGTWKLMGEEAKNSVKWALEAGYRHIDTATLYGNEKQIGSNNLNLKKSLKYYFTQAAFRRHCVTDT